ncbi:MAG: hypothetical protein HY369_00530 [Candidatus Aenigmarchaeota archaeon]|nr:hypothetical protein [Candidatus Aenigmarchaeota archaeon]
MIPTWTQWILVQIIVSVLAGGLGALVARQMAPHSAEQAQPSKAEQEEWAKMECSPENGDGSTLFMPLECGGDPKTKKADVRMMYHIYGLGAACTYGMDDACDVLIADVRERRWTR